MRRLTPFLVSLVFMSCARDPVTPANPVQGDVVAPQPTGTYDIYVYDISTGSAVQATTLSGLEFNPAFSPDGKFLVHDVLTFDPFAHSLYITDIATHVSIPLLGGDGGNDGDWSPSGLIVFDRSPYGDVNIYVVPAGGGGTPVLVRPNAVDAQWGPDGQHIVFTDATDGSIRTLDLKSGAEHLIVPFGVNPAWSRDGRRIAYSDNHNIFFVPVSPGGARVGASVQLTFDDVFSVFSAQASWAADGMSLVFSSNRGDLVDWDIWVVSVNGGEPARLAGMVGTGDFDPAFYQKKLVAFPAFTPPGP